MTVDKKKRQQRRKRKTERKLMKGREVYFPTIDITLPYIIYQGPIRDTVRETTG